nr:hypothetical protein [Caulobacter flavus]
MNTTAMARVEGALRGTWLEPRESIAISPTPPRNSRIVEIQ